jgi:hypothetical protein
MTLNALPRIIYQNRGDGAIVTASTEAAGYDADNLKDWRQDLAWKGTGTAEQWLKYDAGSPISAQALVIFGHDLFTQSAANLVLEGSDNDSVYTPVITAFTPSDDGLIVKYFSQISYRYWKLTIPTGYTAAPTIQCLFIGNYLELETFIHSGFDPNKYSIRTTAPISRGGKLLGMSKEMAVREFSITIGPLTDAWVRGAFATFWNAHINTDNPKPFYFAWDATNAAGDCFYCWLPAPDHNVPYNKTFRSMTLTMNGVVE